MVDDGVKIESDVPSVTWNHGIDGETRRRMLQVEGEVGKTKEGTQSVGEVGKTKEGTQSERARAAEKERKQRSKPQLHYAINILLFMNG